MKFIMWWNNFIRWLNRNKPQKMFMGISDFNFDGFMDIKKIKINDLKLLNIYKLKTKNKEMMPCQDLKEKNPKKKI